MVYTAEPTKTKYRFQLDAQLTWTIYFSSPATGRKAIAFCPSKTAAEMIAAGMNRSIVRA